MLALAKLYIDKSNNFIKDGEETIYKKAYECLHKARKLFISVNDIKGEWACLSYFNFIGNKMKGEYWDFF